MTRLLRILVTFDGDAATISLGGKAVFSVREELAAALDAVLRTSVVEIDVDLSELDAVDATALRTFVDAHRRAEREDRVLRFRAPQPAVRRVLARPRVLLQADRRGTRPIDAA
jgi:anti-anti-sigma regulatory factor